MTETIPAAHDAAAPERQMSEFANTIYQQKYAHPGEDWPKTANRVATEVMAALGYHPESWETRRIEKYIREKKFLPGGRYLYASGRKLHQVQNCLLMRADDTREGWAELMHNAGMALMTGAGIGVVYTDLRERGAKINKTGGFASGPISSDADHQRNWTPCHARWVAAFRYLGRSTLVPS